MSIAVSQIGCEVTRDAAKERRATTAAMAMSETTRFMMHSVVVGVTANTKYAPDKGCYRDDAP